MQNELYNVPILHVTIVKPHYYSLLMIIFKKNAD